MMLKRCRLSLAAGFLAAASALAACTTNPATGQNRTSR